MKPTYTREQLEALRDCNNHTCLHCDALNICNSRHPGPGINIAADLLSSLDEIERLRTALEPLAVCSDLVRMNTGYETCIENERDEQDWCDGCKARNALKETTNGR